MKFLYWIFLLITIIGGVSIGFYGAFGVSLWDQVPTIENLFFSYSLEDIIRIIIGIASMIVLFANFSISFKAKDK